LDQSGVFANEGKMVDASFVEVPRQRNTREENKEIKEGKIPVSWGENSHKLAQKDTDARWTKKSNISFYGYKNPGAAAQWYPASCALHSICRFCCTLQSRSLSAFC
jgi:hypothetical protein